MSLKWTHDPCLTVTTTARWTNSLHDCLKISDCRQEKIILWFSAWSDQNHLKWSEPLGVIRTTWSEQNHLEWSETQTRYIIQKSHMNPDRHNLLLPTLQAALHRRTPAPDPHNSCNYHSSDLFWSDDYSWTPNSDGAKYIRITSIFLTSISRSIDLHIHYMTEVTEASLYLNQPWEDK